MSLYPRARHRLLPENADQPRIAPTQVIAHTAVDGANTTSLYDWFANGTNLESHFYVARDGTVEQYMDTNTRADANNKANARAVSIETWDGRHPDKPANRWTDAQARALIDLIGWICATHGIPRRLAPAWDQPGIGWHNQYREWSPGATGCPGPLRAAQLRDEIIPALNPSTPCPTLPHPAPGNPRRTTLHHLTNTDGRVELLDLNQAGQVVSTWQDPTQGGRLTGWAPINATQPGPFDDLVAYADPRDGRLVAIGTGAYGVPFVSMQTAPSAGPWTEWVNYSELLAYVAGLKGS